MELGDIVRKEGAVVIPFREHPITHQDLSILDELTDFREQREHYRHITKGDRDDKHNLWKLRIRDDAESVRDYHPNVDQIVGIIGSPSMFELYREVDPAAQVFRRIQVNLLQRGGFVGPHIDRGSNPQWLMVCVLPLSRGYQGGDYVINHYSEGEKRFRAPYGSLLIARTDVDHRIATVNQGIRKTLVYFLGMDLSRNFNYRMVKPSR